MQILLVHPPSLGSYFMPKIHRVLMLAAMSCLLSTGTAIAEYIDVDYTLSQRIATKGITAGASTDKFLTATTNPVYFPLTLPNRANTRFARISFSFTDANSYSGVAPIQFDLEQLQVFAGTPDQLGSAIEVQSSWIDEIGTLWIQFDRALAAKTNLTITLKTKKLPPTATYGYSVAAYSQKQPPSAVFVEDGTLTVHP
jgi:Protein of unknown function (DUF2808)